MPAQQRRPGLPTIMFLSELMNIGPGNVPPVTLVLIATQFMIYFGLLDDLHDFHPRNVCIGYDTVWRSTSFFRLFTGALVHLDEWHLYYNMMSLLWKGTRLEGRRFSSSYFFCLILAFIPLCGIGTIILDYAMAELFQDYGRLNVCAAGFSAVLFALKVLANHYDENHTVYVGGLSIASKYACWAELVLIQLVTPNASFTGHLAGILVGLLYTYKPLKRAIDFLYYGAIAPLLGVNGNGNNRRHEENRSGYAATGGNPGWNWSSFMGGQGTRLGGASAGNPPYSNGASRANYQNNYRPPPTNPDASPFTQYTGGLSEDDQVAWALRESIHQTPTRRQWAGAAGNRATPPRYGWNAGS